jgi:hypothetical protein
VSLLTKLADKMPLETFTTIFERVEDKVKEKVEELKESYEKVYFVPYNGKAKNPSAKALSNPKELKDVIKKTVLGNIVDENMRQLVNQFCTQEDNLFFAKLQKVVQSTEDIATEYDAMENEFNGFLRYLTSQTSMDEATQFVEVLSQALGATKADSYDVYQEQENIRKKAKLKTKEKHSTPTVEAEQFNFQPATEDASKEPEEEVIDINDMRRLTILSILQSLSDMSKSFVLKCTFGGAATLLFKNPAALIRDFSIPPDVCAILEQVNVPQPPEDDESLPKYIEDLSISAFIILRRMTEDQFGIFTKEIQGFVQSTIAFHNTVQDKVKNRKDMENRLINEMSQLSKRVDLTVPKVCEFTVAVLERFFKHYYTSFSSYISILENPIKEQRYIENNTDGTAGLLLYRLKYIASSSKDRSLLLNRIVNPGEGVSFSILESKMPKFVTSIAEQKTKIKIFSPPIDERSNFIKNGSYYGIPLIVNLEPIGVLGIDNVCVTEKGTDVEPFKDEDLRLAVNISKRLCESIERIERRSKLVILAVNSMKWTSDIVEANVEFYLVEKDYILEDGQKREVMRIWLVQIPDANSDVKDVTLEHVGSESFEK